LYPSHANRSTGGVRTRGQSDAQRSPKIKSVGGKSKGKKSSKEYTCQHWK